MLNPAFKLSSNWQFFHHVMVFARQHNPETLAENIIRHFIEMKVTESVCSKQQVFDEEDVPIRTVSSNTRYQQIWRKNTTSVISLIDAVVQPVYTS